MELSNYHRVWYFLLKFCTRFLLTNIYKRVFRTFLFCLDLELLKTWSLRVCRNHVFFILTNNSRSKQNEKNPKHPFVDLRKFETCAKFQQKLLNSLLVGTRQSFQSPKQNTWFLENRRALSKFLYGILLYLKVH